MHATLSSLLADVHSPLLVPQFRISYLPMSPLRHLFRNSSGNSKHISSVSLVLTIFNLYFHFFTVVLEAFAISHSKH